MMYEVTYCLEDAFQYRRQFTGLAAALSYAVYVYGITDSDTDIVVTSTETGEILALLRHGRVPYVSDAVNYCMD